MPKDLHSIHLEKPKFSVQCLLFPQLASFEQYRFGPKQKSRSSRSQEAELTCSISRISNQESGKLSITFADPKKSRAHQTLATTDMALATEKVPTAIRSIQLGATVKRETYSVQVNDNSLSQRVISAIRSSIRGEKFQKSSIEIAIVILQDDGGMLSPTIIFTLLYYIYLSISLFYL